MKKTKIWMSGAWIAILIAVIAAYPSLGANVKEARPFTDIHETDWFYADVGYVSQNGLMTGTGDGIFSPYDTVTRGMMVTVLWRLGGEPMETGRQFADVGSDAYYHTAVAWASNHGIVSGYDATTFAPDDCATREQLMTILHRFAAYRGLDVSGQSDLTAYADGNNISDYAQSAMQWGHAGGLITGVSADTLAPQAFVQRCQAAAIITRFCTQQDKTEAPNANAAPQLEDTDNPAAGGRRGQSKKPDNATDRNDEDTTGEGAALTVEHISAKPGDEVQVKAVIHNNPGILGMALTAYYDETALTLQRAENGGAFAGVLEFTSSKALGSGARFLWDGLEITDNDAKDGEILILHFKISDTAEEGEYPIELQYADGDIVDNQLDSVSLTIDSGAVNIHK